MGQMEVLQFLQEQRKTNDEWFDVNQIKDGLRGMGVSESALKKTHDWLYKLCCFNMVDFKGQGLWKHRKLFRCKK